MWRRRGWSQLPWHPLLFVVGLVAAQYLGQITSIMAVWRSLAVGLLSVFVVTLAAGVLLRSVQLGAIVVSCLLLVLRSRDVLGAFAVLAAIGAVSLIASRILGRRQNARTLAAMTRILNLFGTLLVAVLLVNLAISGRVVEARADLTQGVGIDALRAQSSRTGGVADAARPDVYLIQLDGYPRADTLQRLFGFDNTAFLSQLDMRGLAVSPASRSNYMYTELTMASMLQMRHIADIPGIDAERDLRLKINHNPTFDAFRDRGYLVIASASGWETEAMRSADVFCGLETTNDFELNLFGPTVLGNLVGLAGVHLSADRERASTNAALDCISAVADVPLDQPRFTYAHVPSPHLPILFDKAGNPAPIELYGYTAQELQVSAEEFQRGYTEGIEYLNARVLDAIDEIRSKAATPPIIIVFSDHGSESLLNWGNALLSDMEERFSNFFAASTPGAPGLYGASPTPVNLFPILLNHYFGAEIPLQPDDRFVSKVQDRLGLSPAPPLQP